MRLKILGTILWAMAAEYIRTYSDERPFVDGWLSGPYRPYDPSPEYADRYRPEDMPDQFRS